MLGRHRHLTSDDVAVRIFLLAHHY
jgi:hypothetical protein